MSAKEKTDDNELIVWKIGSENRPALPEDIDDFYKKLKHSLETGDPLVTHHAVDFIKVKVK